MKIQAFSPGNFTTCGPNDKSYSILSCVVEVADMG